MLPLNTLLLGLEITFPGIGYQFSPGLGTADPEIKSFLVACLGEVLDEILMNLVAYFPSQVGGILEEFRRKRWVLVVKLFWWKFQDPAPAASDSRSARRLIKAFSSRSKR
jgi:hypothetical protein